MAIAWNTIQNTFTPRADLTQFGATVDYLDQQHKSVLEQSNKLLETFHELNLNEKEFQEDGIVPKYMGMFNDIMNDYEMNGDLPKTYNDLMGLTRKMLSSPDLIGRIQANDKYEEFKKSVNDNKTLPQNIKNYLLSDEVNPYYYEDVENDDGTISIGNEWKPKKEMVDHIGADAIVEKALKFVPTEKGVLNSYFTFLDSNGYPTSNMNDSRDGKIYSKGEDGNFETVRPEKVSAAIDAMLDADPAIRASLQQDFDVAVYEFYKEQQKLNDEGKFENFISFENHLTDENGLYNTVSDYIYKTLYPFIPLSSYVNITQGHASTAGRTVKQTTSKQPDEDWKEIPGGVEQEYNGYQIGNDGYVYKQQPNGKYRRVGEVATDSSGQRRISLYSTQNGGSSAGNYTPNNVSDTALPQGYIIDPDNPNHATKIIDGSTLHMRKDKNGEWISTNKRYGGIVRRKAAFGLSVDDEDGNYTDDDNSMTLPDNDESGNNIITATPYNTPGTVNVGLTTIRCNAWESFNNCKSFNENILNDAVKQFMPDVAGKYNNDLNKVIGISGAENENNRGAYNGDIDALISDLVKCAENEQNRYISNNGIIDNIDAYKQYDYAVQAIRTAAESYKYFKSQTDAIQDKIIGDIHKPSVWSNFTGAIPVFGGLNVSPDVNHSWSNFHVRDLSKASFLRASENMFYSDFTDDNDFGREMIYQLNNIFPLPKEGEQGQVVKITVPSTIASAVATKMGLNSLSDYGIPSTPNADESITLTIDDNYKKLLPKLACYLTLEDDNRSGLNVWKWFRKNTSSRYYDDDCFGVKMSIIPKYEDAHDVSSKSQDYFAGTGNDKRDLIRWLGYAYNFYATLANQVENDVGNTNYAYLQNVASSCETAAEFAMSIGYGNDLSTSDKNSYIKKGHDNLINMLSNANFINSAYMEVNDGVGLMHKTYEQAKYGNLIKEALAQNRLTISYCPMWVGEGSNNDATFGEGYVLTISPSNTKDRSADSEKNDILAPYDNKPLTIYVSGAFSENQNVNLMANPVVKTAIMYSQNRILSYNTPQSQRYSDAQYDNNYQSFSSTFIPNLGPTVGLGDTRFMINDGNRYSMRMFGDEFTVSEDDAKDMSQTLFMIQDVKNFVDYNIQSGRSFNRRNVNDNIRTLATQIRNDILRDYAKKLYSDPEIFKKEKGYSEEQLLQNIISAIETYVYYDPRGYRPTNQEIDDLLDRPNMTIDTGNPETGIINPDSIR